MIARLKPCAAERGAARPQPRRRTDRLQPDPVARHQGRRGGRSRRMRAGGAPGGGAGRADGQGPASNPCLLSVSGGRLQGQLIEAARRHQGRRGHRRRHRPRHLGRHAPRHRRRAAPCCTRCRSATRSTASRASAIRAAWWRAQFGVDMNVVTADAAVARNLMLVVERCHLNVEAMAASALCRRPVGADRRRGRSRRRRGRYGRRHHHDRDLSPAAASSTPTALRSAGNTSRWISRAGSAHASRMPSESRRYTAAC